MDKRDIEELTRALDLAENGRGCTNPNPIVGAVISRGNERLGEGWHAGAGLDHAEVAAIKDALARAGVGDRGQAGELDWRAVRKVCSGATMYVTLEPCCTQGRTPPCTTALVKGEFARVVAAAIDPSPWVNGQGLQELREAGVEVEVAEGDVARRAKRQNDGLRKIVAAGVPFVTYKYAMTIDGRVATDTGDSRWVSGVESRKLVHRWRAWSDAVVVGAGTLESDDPTLTARDVGCTRQPLRVVVDGGCSIRRKSRLVDTMSEGAVLVVCGPEVSAERRREVESWGVSMEVVPMMHDGVLDPQMVGEVLAERGVQSVLLEGGPRLAGSWWSAGLIDKVAAFISPKVVAGMQARCPVYGAGSELMRDAIELHDVEVACVGTDVLVTGYTGGPF